MLNLKRPINDVIIEYPIIETFLLKSGVDCATCSVGTCLVEDILEIHNFSKEDQKEMFEQMNLLVENKTTEIKEFTPMSQSKKYSKVVDMLIEEHKLIKELIYMAEYIVNKDNFLVEYKDDFEKIVHYLKYYSDDFHHGKEEDVLFYMFERNDILNAMYQEHDQGRDYRKEILASNDEVRIREIILEYAEMLKEHIHKEDNILFPYLDRLLTEGQLKTIDEDLEKIDLSINDKLKDYIEEFNNRLFSF